MVLTNKQKFNKKYKQPQNKSNSLKEIAKLSGFTLGSLQKIYNKGIGAYKTNLSSVRIKGSFKKNPNVKKFPARRRLTKEQWAIARVYSVLMKGGAYKFDKDLLKKSKKKK